jgi:prepilin-type N-terminal cleavage/methylation domain-containing protein
MLENFTRLLSSLLAAGVPLSRALVILCKEASNPTAAAKWKAIYDSVVDGVSLADSMATMPETFPRVYVAMVSAGETGGFLDLVLAQIADFQAREKDLKSKVTAAMLYPAILLVLAIGVIDFLMTFFIPRFQTMFAGFGGQLPLLTRIIVAISHWIGTTGFSSPSACGGGIPVRNWVASEKGRRTWEGFICACRCWGRCLSQFAMARFAGCWAPCSTPACRWCRRSTSPAAPSATRFWSMPFPIPSSGSRKARNWAPACPIANPFPRLGAGDDFRRRRKRQAGPGIGAHRRRDGRGPGPEPENGGGVAGAVDALFHRRVYRNHFHRDDLPDLFHARLHQIKRKDIYEISPIAKQSPRAPGLRQRAFTLVELLLVLTILAILAGIVLPKMVGRGEQARQTAAMTQISTFGHGLGRLRSR